MDELTLSCSFCGKSEREAKALVRGPAIYICDECLGVCIYAAEQQCPGILYELLDGIALDVSGEKEIDQ